jgi:hypothetical protein
VPMGTTGHEWRQRDERQRLRRDIHNFTDNRNRFGLFHHAERIGLLGRSAGARQLFCQPCELHGRPGHFLLGHNASHQRGHHRWKRDFCELEHQHRRKCRSDQTRISISFLQWRSAALASTTAIGGFTVPTACTIASWDIDVSPSDTATVKTYKVATGTTHPDLQVIPSALLASRSRRGGHVHSVNANRFHDHLRGRPMTCLRFCS